MEPGATIAVYDLGGGTFDAAVLRRTTTGFELLGIPEGMERFGGIDIDRAVLAYVDDTLAGELTAQAEHPDAAAAGALARLRDDARTAKEALSSDSDAVVAVLLPGLNSEVRLTRAELENMIRPRLTETIDTLHRTVRSAGLDWQDLTAILAVGGSSRIPLVREVVRDRTGRPVVVDAHPKHAIALGAAAAAWAAMTPPVTVVGAGVLAPPVLSPPTPASATPSDPAAVAPATGSTVARRSPSKRTLLIGGGVVAAILLVGGVLFTQGGGDTASLGDTISLDDTTVLGDTTSLDDTTLPTTTTPHPTPRRRSHPRPLRRSRRLSPRPPSPPRLRWCRCRRSPIRPARSPCRCPPRWPRTRRPSRWAE